MASRPAAARPPLSADTGPVGATGPCVAWLGLPCWGGPRAANLADRCLHGRIRPSSLGSAREASGTSRLRPSSMGRRIRKGANQLQRPKRTRGSGMRPVAYWCSRAVRRPGGAGGAGGGQPRAARRRQPPGRRCGASAHPGAAVQNRRGGATARVGPRGGCRLERRRVRRGALACASPTPRPGFFYLILPSSPPSPMPSSSFATPSCCRSASPSAPPSLASARSYSYSSPPSSQRPAPSTPRRAPRRADWPPRASHALGCPPLAIAGLGWPCRAAPWPWAGRPAGPPPWLLATGRAVPWPGQPGCDSAMQSVFPRYAVLLFRCGGCSAACAHPHGSAACAHVSAMMELRLMQEVSLYARFSLRYATEARSAYASDTLQNMHSVSCWLSVAAQRYTTFASTTVLQVQSIRVFTTLTFLRACKFASSGSKVCVGASVPRPTRLLWLPPFVLLA